MIPYGKQLVEEDDIQAVVDVLRSDFLTQGPKVAEFEEAFAAKVGAKYAVAVNSGTAALHACMVALGVGPGDEVIVPPITFTATVNCVLFVGGTPVFADVLPSGHIDPIQIEQKITKKTKAVIAVDYAGWPCDYGRILEICEKNGLILICDACHALGATWNGRPVGSIGKLNCFSFHPVKHIATGEGGMITTDDPELAVKMQEFRTHGITKDATKFKGLGSGFGGQGSVTQSTNPPIPQSPNQPIPQSSNPPINQSTIASLREAGPWHYEMQSLGYNYRLSDINCALGLSQLRKLDRFVARRREIAKMYYEGLSNIPVLTLPISDLQPSAFIPHPSANLEPSTFNLEPSTFNLQPSTCTLEPSPLNLQPSSHSFHLFPVLIDFIALGKTRTQVMAELRERGVGSQVHYIPVSLQPFYREKLGIKPGDYPGAEKFFVGELSIPMYPDMKNHEVDLVINALRSVLSARH
jgi:perosamine synthetase